MDFIQKPDLDAEGVHSEHRADSFIAEHEIEFLESAGENQKRVINHVSGKVGDIVGKKVSDTVSKNSIREITRTASKEAAKKVAEESVKKVTKETVKQTTQKVAKDSATFIVTTSAASTTTTVTTVAGSAVGTATGFVANPILGTVTGFVVGNRLGKLMGDVTGTAIDKGIVNISAREKMIKGLAETTDFEGDGNEFIKGAGQAALMEFGAYIRRIGTTIKWTNWALAPMLTPFLTVLVVLLLMIPLLCLPVGVCLSTASEYAGGFVDLDGCAYFCQYEDPWADYAYGDSTISSCGCGPVTMAIVASTLTEEEITPYDTADYAMANGFYLSGSGTLWSFFETGASNYGLESENCGDDLLTALECIQDGGMVVISVGLPDINGVAQGNSLYRGRGHFMAIRGITDEGKILVADPASRSNTEAEWDYETVEEILKNCWSITYTPSEE